MEIFFFGKKHVLLCSLKKMKPLGVITIASKPLDFKYLAVIAVLFLTANGLFSVMAIALGKEM